MASIQRQETQDGSPRYKVYWRDPAGKQLTKTFERKAAAEAWSNRVEASKLDLNYYDPSLGKHTIGECYELLMVRAEALKPSTREGYRYVCEHYLLPELRNVPVGGLARGEARAFLNDLAHPAPTVHACYRVLRLLVQEGVEAGWIPSNPLLKLRISRGEPKPLQILTPQQIADLAHNITPRYSALIYVLAYGGLRIGEAAGLEREDFDGKTLRITRSTTEVAGKLSTGTPKTASGTRMVRLPARVAEMLEMHCAFYEGAHIFAGADGGVLRASNFRSQHFLPACRKAGIDPAPRIHDLRHAMASIAMEAGVPLQAVQEALGHSSPTMTAHYSHSTSPLQDAFVAALDAKIL